MKINRYSLRKCSLVPMFFINAILLCSPGPASADSLSEYSELVVAERFLSLIGDVTWQSEKTSIDFAWQRYLNQHAAAAVFTVGQVSIDEQFPTALYDPAISTTETLSFQFIDPSNGLPATSFPTVSSVFYEVSDDPNTNIFTPLGTSTNSSSDFSIMYSISGFEPIIRATPLDTFGSPIVISGVDAENVAIGFATNIATVPLPASVFLLASGLMGLLVFGKQKRA